MDPSFETCAVVTIFGHPPRVHYIKEGDDMLVDKVIVSDRD